MGIGATSQKRQHYWQQQIKRWSQSSVSGMQYCREHNLSYHRFAYWRKKLGSSPASNEAQERRFTKVVRREGSSDHGLTMILPNGISFQGITTDHIKLIGQLLEQF